MNYFEIIDDIGEELENTCYYCGNECSGNFCSNDCETADYNENCKDE